MHKSVFFSHFLEASYAPQTITICWQCKRGMFVYTCVCVCVGVAFVFLLLFLDVCCRPQGNTGMQTLSYTLCHPPLWRPPPACVVAHFCVFCSIHSESHRNSTQQECCKIWDVNWMDGEFNLPLISPSENSLKHYALQIALTLPVTHSVCFSPSSLYSTPWIPSFYPHLPLCLFPPNHPLFPSECVCLLTPSSPFFSLSVVCDAEKPSGLNKVLCLSSQLLLLIPLSCSVCVCVCVHACMCGQTLRSNTA